MEQAILMAFMVAREATKFIAEMSKANQITPEMRAKIRAELGIEEAETDAIVAAAEARIAAGG